MESAASQVQDPVKLTKLAYTCCIRFQTSGALEDIDKAVEYATAAISLTPNDDPEMLLRLTILATSSSSKFQHLGNRTDLDRAIECWRQTISLTSQEEPGLPTTLTTLGLALNLRFQRFHTLEDPDEGIEHASHAISLVPHSHPDFPDRLHSLGCLLITRFDKLDNLVDLDKAIQHMSQTVSLAPQGHPESPSWLHKLGSALNRRFNRLGDIADLDEAIKYTSQAVSVAPEGCQELLVWLNNLGAYLDRRFEQLSESEDLKKAIEYKRQALSISPEGHSDRHIQLNNLAHSLLCRSEHLGDPEDLREAIKYQRQAVSVAPPNHPEMITWVSNLSELLRSRYQRFGEISDLDEAILSMSDLISVAHKDRKGMPLLLNNLGISLYNRFERLGEIRDLRRSIEYISQAVSLTPEGDPATPYRLCNLGDLLDSRFKRLRNIEDLNQAINYTSRAISLISTSHRIAPTLLSTIGLEFWSRFKLLENVGDLHKAIEHMSQAVSLIPQGHPDLPKWTNSLCIALQSRFKRLGEFQDLERAVEHAGRQVSHLPPGHPETPVLLSSLGFFHIDRSDFSGMAEDIQRSIDFFQKAAESSTGDLYSRYSAALEWARICARHRTGSLLLAYGKLIELAVQYAWLGDGADGRYRPLNATGEVFTEAAAAAITMQNYQLAIEWLEEGRSIGWRQRLQLPTPFDDLLAAQPTLAENLNLVVHDLGYSNNLKRTKDIMPINDLSLEQAAQRHRRLAERWEELIDQVRNLPGFNDFLRPRRASELMRSAHSGPVVILNVHETGCDALILKPEFMDIAHIPLDFSCGKAKKACDQLKDLVQSRGLTKQYFIQPQDEIDSFDWSLAMLWVDIVKPVLDYLGYTNRDIHSTGELPHITWCATGPLSFLPLHAAGDYNSDYIAFNYVISSYTPTLSTLLSPPLDFSTFSGILAVGQELTPNIPPLPGAADELARILEKSQGLAVTRLDGYHATPEAVLVGMEKHGWVHLACHAIPNTADPTQSAFYLHGGTLDLATIARKRLKYADLVFISACGTASEDENLSEEAVYLAAGMIMAGYRTVITTIWSIGEQDASLVAEKVYE